MPLDPAPRAVRGSLIFLDLDDYLSSVRDMTPAEEWDFVRPLYFVVEQVARQFGFTLARTFGDGFLLYREAAVDNHLLTLSGSFVSVLRTRLSQQRTSFKASFAGGGFIIVTRSIEVDNYERLLCGPLVNLAGKRLAGLPQRSVFCSWPLDHETSTDHSYDELDNPGTSRHNFICSLDEIDDLSALLDRGMREDVLRGPISSSMDSLQLSNAVKTFVLETVKLADDKAKAVFAVSAALLVYLFNGGGWPKPDKLLSVGDIWQWMRLITLCLSMIALLISSVFSLLVLIPRMTTSFRGTIFFGSIAEWPSAKAYADYIIQLDSASLQHESAMHNYEISKVAMKKYVALNRSLRWMALGILTSCAYFGLSWLTQAS